MDIPTLTEAVELPKLAHTIDDARAAIKRAGLRHYINPQQLHVMLDYCKGEEGDFFIQKLISLAALTEAMPGPYETEHQGDEKLVYLHYFNPSMDWYICETDSPSDGEQMQCFGLADLFQDNGELGYIPICELIESGVELDLHWTPKPLETVKKARGYN